MKTCPNCGELIGDNAKECFNCYYNYSYGRVITPQERSNERARQDNEKQQKVAQEKVVEEMKKQQLQNNPLFEYKAEILNDEYDGSVNESNLQRILNKYASEGWKLHSAFTNEIGKTSTGVSVSFLGTSVNATIDQTVLIFERCIRAGV